MDYKIINKRNQENRDANMILIHTDLLEYFYDLLHAVDGVCVWSPRDNQYIKVNDIDETVIEEVELMLKINKLK